MKGFIEVTERMENYSVLCPVGKITAVIDMDDGVFIETGFDGRGKSTGICVTESYENIKQKLIKCEV